VGLEKSLHGISRMVVINKEMVHPQHTVVHQPFVQERLFILDNGNEAHPAFFLEVLLISWRSKVWCRD
jgi:hypothetical protein